GGFSDAHLDAIRSVVAPLARVAEVRALTRTSSALLDTYVGHKTGDRVRAGSIRRGDTDSIKAAIWLSDMRGFTARTEIARVEGLRFGLALHLGDVLYGNIGSGDRLDFTCIGPAVNLAARLEKIAAREGRAVVASAEFAQHCGAALTSLGEFDLAGFHEKQPAFALPDD